jgi:hypothetical protein
MALLYPISFGSQVDLPSGRLDAGESNFQTLLIFIGCIYLPSYLS